MPPPLPRFRSDAPDAGPCFRTEVCFGSGACGSSLGRRQRGIDPALSRFLSDAPAVVPLLRPVACPGAGAFGSSKTGRVCPAIVVGYCCPAIRVGWLGLSPAVRLRSARVRLPVSLVPWLARSGPSCFAWWSCFLSALCSAVPARPSRIRPVRSVPAERRVGGYCFPGSCCLPALSPAAAPGRVPSTPSGGRCGAPGLVRAGSRWVPYPPRPVPLLPGQLVEGYCFLAALEVPGRLPLRYRRS